MPQAALSRTPFCNCHGGQDCLNPFTATRKIAQPAEEETETDYIDSNLPDDSIDGLEQNNEDGGVPENLISGVGIKIETVYYFLF